MSRYPLRDIAGTLAGAPDLDSALASILSYLRALHADWHPSIALYEPRKEHFEHVFDMERGRLERRDVTIPIDHLPQRLVRKFVRPSAFFNADARRSLLEKLFRTNGVYEPDPVEARQLQPVTAPVGWQSCVCLPLNDRHELLGMLVIVSPTQAAFGQVVEEALQPLRGLASLAIARRLHAGGRPSVEDHERDAAARRTQQALQQRLRELESELGRVTAEAEARGATLRAVTREVEVLRSEQSARDVEQAQLRAQASALEDQVSGVGMHMSEAYAQLAEEQSRATEMRETLDLVREAFEVISADPDAGSLTRAFVTWFSDRFQVGRLSLMRVDDEAGDLRITASRGLDPSIAERIRVPMGQGVAGWVAHHRRPVLVREREDDTPVRATGLDTYETDSFMSLPLVHRSRTVGVLNLANKHGGEAFDALDLDRAQLASHVLALALGTQRERLAA